MEFQKETNQVSNSFLCSELGAYIGIYCFSTTHTAGELLFLDSWDGRSTEELHTPCDTFWAVLGGPNCLSNLKNSVSPNLADIAVLASCPQRDSSLGFPISHIMRAWVVLLALSLSPLIYVL